MTSFLSFTHNTIIPVKASDDPVRQQIIVAARQLCGTPFCHQGRHAALGLDCIGVIALTAEAIGLSVKVPEDYGRLPTSGRLLREMKSAGMIPRNASAARMGDVVLMRFAQDPQHLGLLTDRGILHAWQGVDKVVEHNLSPIWQRRVVAVFSYPGVK
ncbi:MAG: hypothetical protein CMF31_01660 [Kordiimonas sp.]|nr:hypothetical protein [Kordiimonas sp.]|tara:strand:+ start:1119 stop:1589 length:471 start_codon:yes stop_codon:yes gene_type:complete